MNALYTLLYTFLFKFYIKEITPKEAANIAPIRSLHFRQFFINLSPVEAEPIKLIKAIELSDSENLLKYNRIDYQFSLHYILIL